MSESLNRYLCMEVVYRFRCQSISNFLGISSQGLRSFQRAVGWMRREGQGFGGQATCRLKTHALHIPPSGHLQGTFRPRQNKPDWASEGSDLLRSTRPSHRAPPPLPLLLYPLSCSGSHMILYGTERLRIFSFQQPTPLPVSCFLPPTLFSFTSFLCLDKDWAQRTRRTEGREWLFCFLCRLPRLPFNLKCQGTLINHNLFWESSNWKVSKWSSQLWIGPCLSIYVSFATVLDLCCRCRLIVRVSKNIKRELHLEDCRSSRYFSALIMCTCSSLSWMVFSV